MTEQIHHTKNIVSLVITMPIFPGWFRTKLSRKRNYLGTSKFKNSSPVKRLNKDSLALYLSLYMGYTVTGLQLATHSVIHAHM